MYSVPIIRGKKVNRYICLIFLVLAVIFLGLAVALAQLQKPELSSTFFSLTMITGGFSLFYGIGWFFWYRKEKKAEEELRMAAASQRLPQGAGRQTSWEFILPKEHLTDSAFRRLMNIIRWTGIAAYGVFLLIMGIQLACGSLQRPFQIVYTLLFCILITIPGIIVQWVIYKKYARSVPQHILMRPGEFVIDDRAFALRDIEKIRISADRVYNPNSPAVFRNLLVQMDGYDALYRIDYRSGSASDGQPFWEEYELFSDALISWGEENSIPVIIDYME